MASRLEELEAPATFTRPLPEVKSAGQVSRRDVLTGRLGKRDAKPRTETITVDKPLNSAIRFGVSEALLRALAMAQGETITEVLVREYGLPLSRRVIPIHTEVKGGQAMPLYPQLASLEFRLPGVDPEKELGENDERLQRLTRQLSERIAEATSGTRPTLHLNVNGGLGRLYQNNNGKILGALYGLQRVAAPLTLRIEDPVLDDDFQARSRMLAEIRDLLRMRSMSLQLVAGAGISELGDVETLLNANAAHMIRLSMVRLGTIHETMTAIIACQDQGFGVLLSGAPAEILGNVALATQPELAAAPDDAAGLEALYGAMARTATWLSRKPGNGEGSLP
jgi:methylaspartate ammonia-lyase